MHTRCTCSECIGTVASLETQSIQYYTVYPQVSTHMPCIVHIHTHVRTHAPSTRTRTHMHTHTLTHTHTQDACLFQVSSLQSQLSESVPSSLLDQANREHRELAVRHQDLLQKQTVYTSNTATVEGLQVREGRMSSYRFLLRSN